MTSCIAILITCYNRKATTLRCLSLLREQKLSVGKDIFLCDDASMDGTSEAVKKEFPEVNVIDGTGTLFWNGGMLYAWQSALSVKDYSAYVWLNDDVILYPNGLQQMADISELHNNMSIICGEFCSRQGFFTYGGKDRKKRPLLPNGLCQNVYYLNGNCVWIPKTIKDRIGLLDSMFIHAWGDYDYGLRAIKEGITILTTKSYIGECEKNPMSCQRHRKDGLSIINRFKFLYSPLGNNPIIAFKYTKRHWGIFKAIIVFVKLHYQNLLMDSHYHRLSSMIHYFIN